MMVAGRYAVLQPLYDTLSLARDERTGAQVFLDEVVLPPELDAAERAALSARVLAAAENAGRLRHPSINRVLEAFTDDGRLWIVTLPISGQPLDQAVVRFGPSAPERVAGLGLELLGALRAAHALGILHRDVKPARVWLTEDGHA